MSIEGRIGFNWEKYISLSEEIFEKYGEEDDDEALDRCGISRAYYGAFHLTVGYMKSCHIFRRVIGEGSHEAVIKDCISYKNNANRKIGQLWFNIGNGLKRMKAMRVKADYCDKYWDQSVSPSLRLKSELKRANVEARMIEENLRKLKEIE